MITNEQIYTQTSFYLQETYSTKQSREYEIYQTYIAQCLFRHRQSSSTLQNKQPHLLLPLTCHDFIQGYNE